MTWFLWLGAALLAGFTLDRICVAAEKRGWIYWRNRPRGSAASAALAPLAEAFNPAQSYVVQEQDRRRLESQQAGRTEPEHGIPNQGS